MLRCFGLAIFAGILFGQSPVILRFAHLQDAQGIVEMGTTIRSIGEIRDVKVDPAERTFTLTGQPWQVELASWLFAQLDRPASAARNPIPPEAYRIREQQDPEVRIFYPSRASSPQAIQELSTVVRSALELRRAFVFPPARAFVVRGTKDEIEAAGWLLEQLEQDSSQPTVWRLPGETEPAVRAFHLKPTLSLAELQEQSTFVRTQTRTRRVFAYFEPRIVVARGTDEQIETIDRLLRERGVLAP